MTGRHIIDESVSLLSLDGNLVNVTMYKDYILYINKITFCISC